MKICKIVLNDMDINEIIKNRRAVSPKFLAKHEIPDEIIWQLLENANWAPSHKKTEPWRFKVYKGNAKQKLVNEAFEILTEKLKTDSTLSALKIEQFKANLEKVPVVIAVILQRNEEMLPEWEEIAAVSMSVQNMWLTATSLGLGAFWATPQFMNLLEPVLNIKEKQWILGFFYVGQIAMELPSPGKGAISEKTEWFS